MSKFKGEQKFMVGDKVITKLYGDRGIITRPKDENYNIGWYVHWTSGNDVGEELWIHENDIAHLATVGDLPLQDAMKGWKVAEEAPEEITAAGMLQEAKDCLVARGVERDKPNGERSMKSTVEAFNALTGHALSESAGWLFMLCLKAARAEGGCFKADDYVDGAAYFALYGEAAAKEANNAN